MGRCIKCNNSYDDDSALYCDKQKECETIWRGDSMSKHTEKLELIAIDKLIPYANNARTHSDEQIKKIQASLREFGFVNPVLIDKDCGIIAGHGRVEAAKREGMKEIPCVWVEHLTDAQKKAYILADNKLAEAAGMNCYR